MLGVHNLVPIKDADKRGFSKVAVVNGVAQLCSPFASHTHLSYDVRLSNESVLRSIFAQTG